MYKLEGWRRNELGLKSLWEFLSGVERWGGSVANISEHRLLHNEKSCILEIENQKSNNCQTI